VSGLCLWRVPDQARFGAGDLSMTLSPPGHTGLVGATCSAGKRPLNFFVVVRI
jgi:hypothetical protein